MAKNYDIVDFRETDDLSPTTTRKLNHNFKRFIDLINEVEIGAIDTAAIAAYILDTIDDDLVALDNRVDNHETRITALEQGGGGGGGGGGGDCTCGAYTVVPWTGSPYDEDKHYDEEHQEYVAVHKVSGYKTWEQLGFEPLSLSDDISAIINGTTPAAQSSSGTVPDLPDDEMCCSGTCIIKVPWTDSPYDENKYYDEDAGIEVSLHTLDGFKTFEELGLEPYDYETLVDSLF